MSRKVNPAVPIGEGQCRDLRRRTLDPQRIQLFGVEPRRRVWAGQGSPGAVLPKRREGKSLNPRPCRRNDRVLHRRLPFPENMQPTIITRALRPRVAAGRRRGPAGDLRRSRSGAVDCYNAGATMLHFHVRDPKTGQGSSNFDQYNELLARVRRRRAEDDHPGRRLDLVRAAHRRRQGQVARLRHAPHADRARPEARLRDGHHRHDAVGRHAGVHPGDVRRHAPGRPEGRPRPGAAWWSTRRPRSTSST